MSFQRLVDVSTEQNEQLKTTWGDHGDYPSGWREVKPDDHRLRILSGCYSPKFITYRQMQPNKQSEGKESFSGFLLFYHDQTGIGYQLYGNHPKFYRFGCDHDMKHVAKLGNCYNAYQCFKCEYREDIDSSD